MAKSELSAQAFDNLEMLEGDTRETFLSRGLNSLFLQQLINNFSDGDLAEAISQHCSMANAALLHETIEYLMAEENDNKPEKIDPRQALFKSLARDLHNTPRPLLFPHLEGNDRIIGALVRLYNEISYHDLAEMIIIERGFTSPFLPILVEMMEEAEKEQAEIRKDGHELYKKMKKNLVGPLSGYQDSPHFKEIFDTAIEALRAEMFPEEHESSN